MSEQDPPKRPDPRPEPPRRETPREPVRQPFQQPPQRERREINAPSPEKGRGQPPATK